MLWDVDDPFGLSPKKIKIPVLTEKDIIEDQRRKQIPILLSEVQAKEIISALKVADNEGLDGPFNQEVKELLQKFFPALKSPY